MATGVAAMYRKYEKTIHHKAFFDTYEIYLNWRKAMIPGHVDTTAETLSDGSIVVTWKTTEILYG